MTSDGQALSIVFADCDAQAFTIDGSPQLTVKDADSNRILWQIKPTISSGTTVPGTVPFQILKRILPRAQIGQTPSGFDTVVAWTAPPNGTNLSVEAITGVKTLTGSYRYGDTDPAGTVRVKGAAKSEADFTQQQCEHG